MSLLSHLEWTMRGLLPLIQMIFRLNMISNRDTNGRIYNLPTVSKVDALIVGDEDISLNMDIILETQSGKL